MSNHYKTTATTTTTNIIAPTTRKKMTIQSSIDNDIPASSSSSSSSSPMTISYRTPLPHEIPICYEIESASYPSDEAASLDSLEYRRDNAPAYFQIAVLSNNPSGDGDDDSDGGTIIGFVCSTRCDRFEEESMSVHAPTGKLLAIHSVVVKESFRRKGVATAMLTRYLEMVQRGHGVDNNVDNNDDGGGGSGGGYGSDIESIVLIAKQHLLGFYVDCGFQVNRPSPIVHGRERWYELERTMARTRPILSEGDGGDGGAEESWFCKTERFVLPFPEVRPHLEAHKRWVSDLRRRGYCITSGYRVDSEGRPGGGGLLFLAARSYDDARRLVLDDPLVANGCVEWELNGWIGQVGDVQMR